MNKENITCGKLNIYFQQVWYKLQKIIMNAGTLNYMAAVSHLQELNNVNTKEEHTKNTYKDLEAIPQRVESNNQ